MRKPVAIILLNWNTPRHTINCITSLKQYCDQSLFDIIVADNGSTDNSLAIISKTYPDIIYLDNKVNLGFAEGNNKALYHSITNGYTYSLLLNTDTEVDEDIVIKLSEHLDLHPTVAAVQPAIYWLHNKTQIWNGEGRFNSVLGITLSNTDPTKDVNKFKKADWLTGCCMLIRNSVLARTGLFTKLFFVYYEDVDLSFRMREAGHDIHYLPSCKMYHEAGVSAKNEPVKKEGILSPVIHYYVSRNHLWILRRYGKPLFFPVYLLRNGSYYLGLLGYFLIRGRNQKARQLLKGIKDGLFTPKNLIWSSYTKQH